MTPDISLRVLTPDDAPALQTISAEVRARYRALPDLAWVADSPPLSVDRIKTGAGWIAERDGKILGFVLTKPVDDLLFIDNISALPLVRGTGTRLLQQVLRDNDDARILALTTFRAPPWNGPWFRRFGFQAIPPQAIGPELAAIIARQSATLDPASRETLWRPGPSFY